MNYKTLILVLLLSVVSQTNAQNESKESHKKIPELGGHKFLSTNNHKSAFISTNLQTDMGFGSTSLLQIPGIKIGDRDLLSFQGKIFYVDFNLQYQQKFNSWLSLYLSYKLTGRVGADLSTIVVDGLNTISGTDIGCLIKIKETDKLYISGTIKANNITGSFINVVDYITDVIDEEPYPALSKKIPATSIGIGVRGAYAFTPAYGLQIDLNAMHGESLQRNTTDTFYSFGILGDVDFMHINETPIALALGYSATSTPEISIDNRGFSNLLTGKVGYSGSDDFELGVQFTTYKVDLKSVESTTTISKIVLGLKFYF